MAAAFRSVVGSVGIALLVQACTSIPGQRDSFSTGQSEIQRCLAQAGNTPRALQDCTGKGGPELAQLSRSALEQGRAASNRANRVSYFLFAAQAGWESAQPDGLQTADAALDAGTTECRQFGAGEFRPPRDCALLQVGPGFVAHVRTLNTLARLEAQASLSADDRQELATTSSRYVPNTFGFVEDRRKQFATDRQLDPSVITLLDRQRAVFFCTALHVSAVDRRLGADDVASKVAEQRRQMARAVPALRRETCQTA